MTTTLLIGLGVVVAGAAGTVARWIITERFNHELPAGTLMANIAASFAMGLLAAADDPASIVIAAGALGALSTWSTVANEVATLAREEEAGLGVAYLALTVPTGILAAWFGISLGSLFGFG